MDEHRLERPVRSRRIVHHALKLRAAVVGRGRTRLDIFGDDGPAAILAPALQLVALVRDGEVFLRLPRCRDPKIESHFHVRTFRNPATNPATSSATPQ